MKRNGLQYNLLVILLIIQLGGYSVSKAQTPSDSPPRQLHTVQKESLKTDSTREEFIKPSVKQYLSRLKQITNNRNNLLYLGTGLSLVLFFRSHDQSLSDALEDNNYNEFELKAPDKLGGLVMMSGLSFMTYFTGRLLNHPNLANTGLYMIEAYFTTQAVTLLGKVTFQRERPNGENKLSFPSGHTSGMFSIASVLDRRYGFKIGLPAYLMAGFVGFSRVKLKKHYPTDVIAGATVGIIIGRSFVPDKNKNRGLNLLPLFNNRTMGLSMQVRF